MAEISKKHELGRLEDFIELAKRGRPVEVEVALRKQSMIQKIDVDRIDNTGKDIETYLLIADYTFKIDDRTHKISKVYMFAVETESADVARANTDIANARLQVDYARLRAVDIAVSTKLF